MIKAVIDTNILVVSNNRDGEYSNQCINNCVDFLLKVRREGSVYLDSLLEIIKEYKKYCSYKGQPGVGDAFFKWLHENQANSKYVRLVNVTKDENENYLGYPAGSPFDKFDPSDRKFLMTSLMSIDKPDIYYAKDNLDWAVVQHSLKEMNIAVIGICADE